MYNSLVQEQFIRERNITLSLRKHHGNFYNCLFFSLRFSKQLKKRAIQHSFFVSPAHIAVIVDSFVYDVVSIKPKRLATFSYGSYITVGSDSAYIFQEFNNTRHWNKGYHWKFISGACDALLVAPLWPSLWHDIGVKLLRVGAIDYAQDILDLIPHNDWGLRKKLEKKIVAYKDNHQSSRFSHKYVGPTFRYFAVRLLDSIYYKRQALAKLKKVLLNTIE